MRRKLRKDWSSYRKENVSDKKRKEKGKMAEKAEK